MRAQAAILIWALSVLLNCTGSSALPPREVYLVARRGKPIGPPSESEQGPARVEPGTVGTVDEAPIPISRAEFLMSSPPSDLPVLRESAANIKQQAATAGPSGSVMLMVARTLAVTSVAGAGALLIFAVKRLLQGGGRQKEARRKYEQPVYPVDDSDERQSPASPATPHPPPRPHTSSLGA
jgi:hypothetical protein